MICKTTFHSLCFALMFAIVSCATALSCPLYESTPSVCEMYGKSTAVFVGKVVAIKEQQKVGEREFDSIQFQSGETFLSVGKNKRIDVQTNVGGIEYCGFEIGQSYLVYAYDGSEGTFFTDGGTRTRLFSEAAPDLEYLRSLRGKNLGASIYGTVSLTTKSSLEKINTEPFGSFRLEIEQKGDNPQVFEALTDLSGRYKLTGLAPGRYQITPIPPDELNSHTGSMSVFVNAKGCAKQDFLIKPNSQIKGRVVDTEGKPIAGVTVEAIPANYVKPVFDVSTGEISRTDASGEFIIWGIPPGQYLLAVNYNAPPETETPFPTTYYPGTFNRTESVVIETTPGRKLDNIEFQLPTRLSESQICGAVFWADGNPAIGVQVYLKEDEFSICCVNSDVKTNAKGTFMLRGFPGRRYRVWAFAEHKAGKKTQKFFGATNIFTSNTDSNKLSLVLSLTEKDSLQALEELEDGERKHNSSN